MVVKWDEEPVKIHCYKYETENHEVEQIEAYRQIRTQIMFTANFMEREITHSNFLKYQASLINNILA
jgi:late competence protein required for DNA uptake (superfamily II DNA/RNA helicase)